MSPAMRAALPLLVLGAGCAPPDNSPAGQAESRRWMSTTEYPEYGVVCFKYQSYGISCVSVDSQRLAHRPAKAGTP